MGIGKHLSAQTPTPALPAPTHFTIAGLVKKCQDNPRYRLRLVRRRRP